MTENMATIVVTAAVSGALTAVLLILVFRMWGKGYLAVQLGGAGDSAAAKIRRAVEDVVESAVPRIREQVEAGFGAAVDEALPRFRTQLDEAAEAALPRFREEVREGFKEALGDAVSGGVLEQAGEEMARKGSSILQTGLELILGKEDERD